MKVLPEHYKSLEETIKFHLHVNNVTIEQVREVYKGYTKQRLVWDLFHMSKWGENNRDAFNLYKDSHLETALVKIEKSL